MNIDQWKTEFLRQFEARTGCVFDCPQAKNIMHRHFNSGMTPEEAVRHEMERVGMIYLTH